MSRSFSFLRLPAADEGRVAAALRLLAAFQLALMLATLPLWLNNGRFPTVPLLSVPSLPPWLLMSASAFIAAGCLLLVGKSTAASNCVLPQRSRWLPSGLLTAGFLAGCCNQHCLQAWHVFFLWNLASCLIREPRRQLLAMRHLPACAYICSGLSRLSPHPEAGPTGMILSQLAGFLPEGLQPDTAGLVWLCYLAACGEVATGALLLGSGWAVRTGLTAAMLLHMMLIAALGPWGLRHSPAVLLWNVCFLLLLPVLFSNQHLPDGHGGVAAGERFSRTPRAWVCLLWGISLAGLIGLTDNWPSWQLYSPRPEQWQLWIDRLYASRVQPEFAAAVSQTSIDGLVAVRLDQASLQRTGSPLYPEDRFQLALIQHILAGVPERVRFRVRIEQPETWRWWRRTTSEINDRRTLLLEHRRFWLNSRTPAPPLGR